MFSPQKRNGNRMMMEVLATGGNLFQYVSVSNQQVVHLKLTKCCFVLFFNIYLFILAAPGLSCGTQDLRCGMWTP